MREILYSELPLELKKQFIQHISKNKIQFDKIKDDKYVHMKVKIIEDEEKKTRLFIPGVDKVNMFEKNEGSKNKYHKECVYSPWEHKRMKNNSKLKSQMKYE